MPSIFAIGSYKIFFWSNEEDEPIHVHVSKSKKPTGNATKIWLTSEGGCILAHNKGRVPARALRDLMEIISIEFPSICDAWKNHFGVEEIRFYC
ncbi:MAG: DUF4160 domain-containing protein [Defluviitaleaceae bacterium]|nr:DUF4160 domain-containing protein [Defluviitaleaceae bacterium]